MISLDEAIKHCLEVAEKNDGEAEVYDLLAKNHNNTYEKLTASRFYTDCVECAADHRQLAEWLTELKEAKRLLKEAVNDLRWLTRWNDPCELCGLMDDDGDCPVDTDKGIDCDNIYKWRLEDEALKLIGEDEK